MVSEDEDGKVMFKVNYHYMSQVKNANDSNSAARSRRLAQEAVTLSTSLPLSSSSSVFVRCDEERLDIMKVTCRDPLAVTSLSLLTCGSIRPQQPDRLPSAHLVWFWLLTVLIGPGLSCSDCTACPCVLSTRS